MTDVKKMLLDINEKTIDMLYDSEHIQREISWEELEQHINLLKQELNDCNIRESIIIRSIDELENIKMDLQNNSNSCSNQLKIRCTVFELYNNIAYCVDKINKTGEKYVGSDTDLKRGNKYVNSIVEMLSNTKYVQELLQTVNNKSQQEINVFCRAQELISDFYKNNNRVLKSTEIERRKENIDNATKYLQENLRFNIDSTAFNAIICDIYNNVAHLSYNKESKKSLFAIKQQQINGLIEDCINKGADQKNFGFASHDYVNGVECANFVIDIPTFGQVAWHLPLYVEAEMKSDHKYKYGIELDYGYNFVEIKNDEGKKVSNIDKLTLEAEELQRSKNNPYITAILDSMDYIELSSKTTLKKTSLNSIENLNSMVKDEAEVITYDLNNDEDVKDITHKQLKIKPVAGEDPIGEDGPV